MGIARMAVFSAALLIVAALVLPRSRSSLLPSRGGRSEVDVCFTTTLSAIGWRSGRHRPTHKVAAVFARSHGVPRFVPARLRPHLPASIIWGVPPDEEECQ